MTRSLLLLSSSVLALACNNPPPAPAPPPASAPAVPASSPTSAPPEPPAATLPLPSPSPATGPSAAPEGAGFERRCGWVDNPTPSNWWLVDRDATWEISVQGGYHAEGDLPDFGTAWVETNGHYGYGCACMDVRVNRATQRVLVVRHVKVLPLARCEHDKKLPPHP